MDEEYEEGGSKLKMRLLHDYNFRDVEEMELALCRATWKLDVVMGRIHDLGEVDDAALYLLDQLLWEITSASHDFASLISRLGRDAVPPEGEEDIKEFLLDALDSLGNQKEVRFAIGGRRGRSPSPDCAT